MTPAEDDTAIFGTIATERPPEEIAQLFAQAGWRARRCTWADWEIGCERAELVIEAATPRLISGSVLPGTDVRALLEPLTHAGLSWRLEVYSPARELLAELVG